MTRQTGLTSKQWDVLRDWVNNNADRIAKHGIVKASRVARKTKLNAPEKQDGWTVLRGVVPTEDYISQVLPRGAVPEKPVDQGSG
jgi:hypothetical protein